MGEKKSRYVLNKKKFLEKSNKTLIKKSKTESIFEINFFCEMLF